MHDCFLCNNNNFIIVLDWSALPCASVSYCIFCLEQVAVWRRFSDFKKLHQELLKIYVHKHFKDEEFPRFPKAKFFGMLITLCYDFSITREGNFAWMQFCYNFSLTEFVYLKPFFSFWVSGFVFLILGRFEDGVIEERRKAALDLLNFAGNIPDLFTSQPFVKFFEVQLKLILWARSNRIIWGWNVFVLVTWKVQLPPKVDTGNSCLLTI